MSDNNIQVDPAVRADQLANRSPEFKETGGPIHNYDSEREPVGREWTTAEMQEEFSVSGFAAPFVIVRRKSDGVEGTLEFKHSPRVYFGWSPTT